MDIMDSTDTPTGGLDGTTASRGALPLSVDERDSFSSPDSSRNGAGSVPTSFGGSASSGSAFDRLDAVSGADRVDPDLPNALPTSTDDLMYPTQEHATHPSVVSGDASAQSSDLSAKAAAKVEDARDSAASMASSAKSTASSVLSSLSFSLHSAGDKASAELSHLRDKATSHSASDSAPASHQVRATVDPGATDTHPDAASMRDAHLHSNFSSLATHENEVRPSSTSVPHVSATQSRGLEAAASAGVEPKDASAGGLSGMLARVHGKVEEGAEAIKDRVDGFAESYLRSSPKAGDHLSEVQAKDIPTLVDPSNEKNTDKVKARLHSSNERAGANTIQDPALGLEDDSI